MSLKSVAYGIISFIAVSLLTIGLSFAQEPFQPVMPETLTILGPSGTTTCSTPNIDLGHIPSQSWTGPQWSSKPLTVSQIQVVISSATTTYYDGWHEVSGYYRLLVNIPVGTEYVVSVRGWNNNGFGEWTVSELNTVVPKGTDCWSNPMRFNEVTSQWIENPACQ